MTSGAEGRGGDTELPIPTSPTNASSPKAQSSPKARIRSSTKPSGDGEDAPYAAKCFLQRKQARNYSLKAEKETFLHCPLTLAPPVPVVIKHGFNKSHGVVLGDFHAKNTNPGFCRNNLGGFYTS